MYLFNNLVAKQRVGYAGYASNPMLFVSGFLQQFVGGGE